jgi:tetratricopeptide (TPR) repeat protein
MVLGFLSALFGCKEPIKKELILIQENHNPYYKIGTKLIEPYMQLPDKSTNLDNKVKVDIELGIRYLDAVTKINPNNFAAYWIKGKGYRALNQHDSAYVQFDKSYQINKDNPDVARELAIECMHLGKGIEAVNVSLHALSLDHNNAGLIGNLALAYLISGDTDLANSAINKALEIDSSDKINIKLKAIIEDVMNGKRTRPLKYDDLKN